MWKYASWSSITTNQSSEQRDNGVEGDHPEVIGLDVCIEMSEIQNGAKTSTSLGDKRSTWNRNRCEDLG